MSLLGHKNIVYHGDVWLGELDTVLVSDENFQFPSNEIRIRHISPGSERCIPLSILHTISQFSLRCKLESSAPPFEQPDLINLHASCFYEFKTAVVVIGDEEIHLVAMPSKQKKFPCFWCYSAPLGLYNSCLSKLNMRCLGIVFDLDETLIVANTLKSFEDRIEALKVWIAHEPDPLRISGMSAELKRYMDDRKLLKQYTENDCVVDYGKVFKVQQEEVPPPSDNHERIVRPVIRFSERNIVLTRINPENRDTSVLVRLRPAWSDLKSYLIAKGRKRFEVYVCTMAERDYALEMWRLLDPEAHLIGSKQLLDRIVCVKSGFRKSLLNVFQLGLCHPNMAMVIDNCCKVWEDRDQPRVHVVPAFTPYYAPHVETANAVPVLCVARNVACNVRGCFFKEFDENILCSISEVFYEDEAVNLPPAPDVSNYLMSEDANFVPNGHTNAPMSEGMNGVEVDRRLNQSDEKCVVDSGMPFVRNSSDLKSETSQPAVAIASNTIAPTSSATLVPSQKPGLLGAPFRRDNSSVKDGLDLRNQNSGQPPLLPRSPGQGGWIVEEEVNRAHPNNRPVSIATGLPSHASQVKGEEASMTHDLHKQNIPLASQPPASSSSSNIFARILKTNKLTGPDNFTDWELDLKILLRFERIEYVLDSPVPIAIAPESTSEERDAFQKWKDDDLRVRSYILLSLSPNLKRQYLELSNSYSIITQLRELFMSQEQVLVYRISIELFHARLADGKPVSPHVRHMMDLIKQLKRSGFPLNETLGRNLILGSLPPIFSQFVMNFNMQGIRCSYNGLHRMLQIAEEDIRKGVLNLISKPSTAPSSKSSKKKKKGKKGAPCPPQKGKVAKPKPKKAAEDKCHHCGKIGHWRRNCPDYLVAISARKATALGYEDKQDA